MQPALSLISPRAAPQKKAGAGWRVVASFSMGRTDGRVGAGAKVAEAGAVPNQAGVPGAANMGSVGRESV